jgi:hypothetical protein
MNKLGSVLLVILICCTVITSFADNGKPGSISGRLILKDGSPMAYAQVFIFNESSGAPPSFDKYWRVPDEVIQADGEGRFRAVLANGKYYLGAIKRKSGSEVGPLQNGDLFLPFYADGQPISYAVVNSSAIDLGTVSGAEPFSKEILKNGDGTTAISGIVTDAHGKPVANALVFAFTSAAMMGKPLFISEKTGKDGTYMLRVYQGGDYYLKIRNSYGGGTMKSGEIMGSYGQDEPSPVSVKTGTIVNGINISGMYFAGQGPKSNSKKTK